MLHKIEQQIVKFASSQINNVQLADILLCSTCICMPVNSHEDHNM
jgi:hypothetical protein